MNILALLNVMLLSFTNNINYELGNDIQGEIVINDIEVMPEEIEGCACFLSRNNDFFNQHKHLFGSNSDSTAFMMINNELIKFKLISTTNEPFTFKSQDLSENYKSEKYELTIDSHFEDSTSYESWNFSGEITIRNKTGKSAKTNFVGTCGC